MASLEKKRLKKSISMAGTRKNRQIERNDIMVGMEEGGGRTRG